MQVRVGVIPAWIWRYSLGRRRSSTASDDIAQEEGYPDLDLQIQFRASVIPACIWRYSGGRSRSSHVSDGTAQEEAHPDLDLEM
jgi:hypothetical protein